MERAEEVRKEQERERQNILKKQKEFEVIDRIRLC
jgi:hypothetical protein